MQAYKTKWLQRWAAEAGLTNEALTAAVREG